MPHQSSQNIQMQLQPQSNQQVPTITNLQKFLHNYNKFISDNIQIELNTDTILNDIALNILQPPCKNNSQNSQQLQQLYIKGKRLPQILDKQDSLIQQLTSRLKKLKDDKVYQTIMFIQQLNYKLSKEYQDEVNRGIENGIYDRRMNPVGNGESLVGIHKTEVINNSGSSQQVRMKEE